MTNDEISSRSGTCDEITGAADMAVELTSGLASRRRKARAEPGHIVRSLQPRNARRGAPMRGQPRGEMQAIVNANTMFSAPALATIIADLVELGARRRFAIKSQVRMDNALGAYVRRACGWRRPPDEVGSERASVETANEVARKRAARMTRTIEAGIAPDDALASLVSPLILANKQGRSAFDTVRHAAEKEMRRLAKQLPVYPWWRGVKGAGDLGLAIVVAEAGDIGSYKSVAALWKRLGLAVINGERQRKHGDRDLASLHGYSPQRRAEIWTLGDAMFRHQWSGVDRENGIAAHPIGPYGEHYGRKKAAYMQRVVDTADAPPGPETWTPKRADNAARRYMTKCLIRDLYGAWRAAMARHPDVPLAA